jgi:hypothetical protein
LEDIDVILFSQFINVKFTNLAKSINDTLLILRRNKASMYQGDQGRCRLHRRSWKAGYMDHRR